MLGLFEDAFLYAPPPPIRPFHWASRLEDGGGEDPGEGRQPGTAPVDAMRPAALLPVEVQRLRRAISAGEGLPALLAQSNSFQNLALAQARPAPAADPASASASASTSASASASAASSSSSSASEFEHGLRVVMHEIVKEAETKGYLYPAEPLSRSRNMDALIRRAASTTRVAVLLVGEGMNRAHHDLLDERCPSGVAMKKV